MLCYGSLQIFLLLGAFLLFYTSTFFSFSHGVSFPPVQEIPTSGQENEGKYRLDFTWKTMPMRSLVEEFAGDEPVEYSSLVLAAKRTHRRDPLNGFKKYTQGWNISEHHYWASVGFTAVPLFAVAAVWFLGFGLCLLLISLCYFCHKRQTYGYSRTCYSLSLVLLILFTLAAIVGCIVLYTGQGKLHYSTTKTLEYVVHQADATVEKLRDVSNYLAAAKQIGIDRIFLPSDVQTDIDQIETKINSSASILENKTTENSDDIQDILDSVRLALIIISAVMLLLTFLGLLFSIFGMQLLVYILVIAGWILVTGTFILCGTFILLHNVAADTCVAMDEWVQYPTAHTALDEILPCVDNATAQETLLRSKEVTSELVNLVNEVITNITNINFAPNFTPLYFNQSGPLVPLLCNPFYADMTNRVCTASEVDLTNATQVWSSYVCQVSETGICTTTGRLTPTFYNQMAAGVNVSFALYNYGPYLIELEDCTFARETFSDISRDHCPGLQLYSRWIYIGLVMVSTAVMLSLIFWVIYGRERRHRLYTKQLTAGSANSFEEDKNH
ncbi:putative Transmembrane protein [Quillaja saponaria]|uniref:Transmembrane protein n=1 Tax=Quillaja saponaria TaxID=32244 RepID=A0AAD7LXL7_QUISA|nr:putative Transmembrane protein [Quillaja saponaria]KAJ7966217.1 putative Transmembrane protein [Quillaja saponaria]